MIISSVAEVIGTDRDVHGAGWKSRRVILAGNGLEYSVHETTVDAGVRLQLKYEYHRETVYCVEGRGTIEDAANGQTVTLLPGSVYSAGIGDPHCAQLLHRDEVPVHLQPAVDRQRGGDLGGVCRPTATLRVPGA